MLSRQLGDLVQGEIASIQAGTVLAGTYQGGARLEDAACIAIVAYVGGDGVGGMKVPGAGHGVGIKQQQTAGARVRLGGGGHEPPGIFVLPDRSVDEAPAE